MAIRIVSKVAGFRRCGIEHPDKPVVYPDTRFTKEQLAMLKAEPMLIVDEVADPKKDDKKAEDTKGKKADDKTKSASGQKGDG